MPKGDTRGHDTESLSRKMAPQKTMLFAYSVTVICSILGMLLSLLF